MTVYGIGLGPGEADPVIVEGERLLRSAVVVYSPGHLSRTVVLNRVPEERIGDSDFLMTRDSGELRRAWKEATAEVTAHANSEDMAFVTLGDPSIYSTFGHLRHILDAFHPEVDLEVVPGVSTMTAFTTALDAEVESGTGLALREATGGATPTGPNHMVLSKVTGAPATHEKLTEAGYGIRFGRRLFIEQDETIVTDDPDKLVERDYYTLIYAERESVKRDMATAEFDGVESEGSA